VPTAISIGEQAARSVAAQLSRYSLTPEAYAQWRARLARAAAIQVKSENVSAIRIEGLSRTNPEIVRRQIESRTGAPVDEAQVITDAQRIFARGDFQRVDYQVSESDTGPVLEFSPVENPAGPGACASIWVSCPPPEGTPGSCCESIT
jgi:NTE family protein